MISENPRYSKPQGPPLDILDEFLFCKEILCARTLKNEFVDDLRGEINHAYNADDSAWVIRKSINAACVEQS